MVVSGTDIMDVNLLLPLKPGKVFGNASLKKNIERDKKNQIDLEKLKWKYLIIWECELKQIENVKVQLENFLKS